MKKLSTMGVALLAIVLASSCGSSKNALQTSALEGEWNIITVNGKEATADKDVFIGLNLKENRVYGCAGCNRIMGAIQVDKDKAGHLSFGQVASTRMLCSDMATERAVLEALENVTGYKGTEQELTLTDGNGNALFTLSKRPVLSCVTPSSSHLSSTSTTTRRSRAPIDWVCFTQRMLCPFTIRVATPVRRAIQAIAAINRITSASAPIILPVPTGAIAGAAETG